MLLKSKVIETIETFDDELELDDLLEKLVLINKISEADHQILNNQVLSEEEADKRMDEWFD
jgi:ribosome-associated protein YbcJ (S4-like RNA binding protein)